MVIKSYHIILAVKILGWFLLKWAGFGELLGWKSSTRFGNTANDRGFTSNGCRAVNWAYKLCFIRHLTCKMKWKLPRTFSKRQCSFRNTVVKNTRASIWLLKVHYMLIQQSLLEIGKFWYHGGSPQINVTLRYVKHIPQHNNLSPTLLLFKWIQTGGLMKPSIEP